MGVASVKFHSEAIGKSTTYNVILPERGQGPFPVLIQRSNLVR